MLDTRKHLRAGDGDSLRAAFAAAAPARADAPLILACPRSKTTARDLAAFASPAAYRAVLRFAPA